MIELKEVRKVYKAKKSEDTIALDGISLKINSKGLVFIVGASGSGKSTLLNSLGGLDSIDSGNIFIEDTDITKLKEKDLDKFRNSYVGFVFQDYNIIEEYNVFENINLSLELQGKNSPKLVLDTLKRLGLDGLENRNINELSGGQKQRVAIARALVKNPNLILADEPTGNLDSKTSKQIFEILKDISKDRVVIVVSHNMEMARVFGDRIIEIHDGKIVSDSKDDAESTTKDNLELVQYHISRKNIFKLTLGNIKAKLAKFVFTIILMSLALFFLEFSYNVFLFKKSSLANDLMHKNEEYYLNLGKDKCVSDQGYVECEPTLITKDDVKELESVSEEKLNPVYRLLDGSDSLFFHYVGSGEMREYYAGMSPLFVAIEDDKILMDLVGSKPQNDNEMVIYQREAEAIVEYGVKDSSNNVYKPENLEELVTDKREILLGDKPVVITGYIKNNDSVLKEIKKSDSLDRIYKEYLSNYVEGTDEYYYVTPDFIKNIELKVDYSHIASGFLFLTREFGENVYLFSHSEIFSTPVNVLTKEGEKELTFLRDDEIILSTNTIQNYDERFKNEFEDFYKEHKDWTYEESLKAYTVEYLNHHRFIDKKVIATREDKLPETEVKIVGINMEDKNYLSQDLLEEYTSYNKSIVAARLYESDKHNIKRIFDNFALRDNLLQDNEAGIINTVDYKFISEIALIEGIYKMGKGYIAVITAIFILFAILLFYSFIATTIAYAKKKIGILKALGTSHKDINKIFAYESLIIGLLSLLFSLVVWIFATKIVNLTFNYTKLLKINYIVIENMTMVVTLVSVIAASYFLTNVCLSRLKSIKPIDAILEKR